MEDSEIDVFNYVRLSQLVESVNGHAEPVDLHGGLVGLLCSGQRLGASQWLEFALETCEARERPEQAEQQEFAVLYQSTLALMDAGEMEFDLLLPDDDQDLTLRIACLSAWCGAFLSALGNFAGQMQGLSEEIQEVLEDLLEISQLDAEDGASEESDFATVVEHVRLCAITLFFEFNDGSTDSDSTVH